MGAVFLRVLNMSITASWLILAVIALRFLLKKAPKWISCLLWGLVGLRLLCPFSFQSAFSLIPSAETVPAGITAAQSPAVNAGFSAVNDAVNPILSESFAPSAASGKNPMQTVVTAAAAVWLAGIGVMLVYALVSYRKLKKTVRAAASADRGIMVCNDIEAPFILGILKPLIYVPSTLDGETLHYVYRHETAHLQRRDHLWKPLGFLVLAAHWFNPLCWFAYVLFCRDIELACDEKVIRDMAKGARSAYTQALLDCSYQPKRISASPLAFGEVGVKQRIRSVLKYKKPAAWIVVIAVVLCAALCVCLMTDPISASETDAANRTPAPSTAAALPNADPTPSLRESVTAAPSTAAAPASDMTAGRTESEETSVSKTRASTIPQTATEPETTAPSTEAEPAMDLPTDETQPEPAIVSEETTASLTQPPSEPGTTAPTEGSAPESETSRPKNEQSVYLPLEREDSLDQSVGVSIWEQYNDEERIIYDAVYPE